MTTPDVAPTTDLGPSADTESAPDTGLPAQVTKCTDVCEYLLACTGMPAGPCYNNCQTNPMPAGQITCVNGLLPDCDKDVVSKCLGPPSGPP